jgi:hypothetical protein
VPPPTHTPVQVGSHTPNFNRMAGNPLAKQIPWDTNPASLAAWKEGNTGVRGEGGHCTPSAKMRMCVCLFVSLYV